MGDHTRQTTEYCTPGFKPLILTNLQYCWINMYDTVLYEKIIIILLSFLSFFFYNSDLSSIGIAWGNEEKWKVFVTLWYAKDTFLELGDCIPHTSHCLIKPV